MSQLCPMKVFCVALSPGGEPAIKPAIALEIQPINLHGRVAAISEQHAGRLLRRTGREFSFTHARLRLGQIGAAAYLGLIGDGTHDGVAACAVAQRGCARVRGSHGQKTAEKK